MKIFKRPVLETLKTQMFKDQITPGRVMLECKTNIKRANIFGGVHRERCIEMANNSGAVVSSGLLCGSSLHCGQSVWRVLTKKRA